MSAPHECPFVLSFDAIAHIGTVMRKLSSINYAAAPDGKFRLRPEIHAPIPLLAYACGNPPSNHAQAPDANNHAMNYFEHLFRSNESFIPNVSTDGHRQIWLDDPFITLRLDYLPEIVRDTAVFGPDLIPTQLVLQSAHRIGIEAGRGSFSPRSNTLGVSSHCDVTIVTHFQATKVLAMAEGFQVWDYTEETRPKSFTPLDILLIKLGLVALEDGRPLPAPNVAIGSTVAATAKDAADAVK